MPPPASHGTCQGIFWFNHLKGMWERAWRSWVLIWGNLFRGWKQILSLKFIVIFKWFFVAWYLNFRQWGNDLRFYSKAEFLVRVLTFTVLVVKETCLWSPLAVIKPDWRNPSPWDFSSGRGRTEVGIPIHGASCHSHWSSPLSVAR